MQILKYLPNTNIDESIELRTEKKSKRFTLLTNIIKGFKLHKLLIPKIIMKNFQACIVRKLAVRLNVLAKVMYQVPLYNKYPVNPQGEFKLFNIFSAMYRMSSMCPAVGLTAGDHARRIHYMAFYNNLS